MKTGIALGSNLGDRSANLRQAREELRALGPVLGCSPIYETEPVECEPGTEAYLNAVVEIDFPVEGTPDTGVATTLLRALQGIEARMGRPSKHPRNAPRTIDLDILYTEGLSLCVDDLVIPHPRLHLRRFVLKPLSDLRPDLILPGQTEPVSELLRKLPATPKAEFFAVNW